jgi:hypothetical protein
VLQKTTKVQLEFEWIKFRSIPFFNEVNSIEKLLSHLIKRPL